MDPHLTTALILLICLILIVMVYIIGVEVGKKSKEVSLNQTDEV